LLLMELCYLFDRFQFQDNLVFHKNVRSKTFIKSQALIFNWTVNLSLYPDTSFLYLRKKNNLIYRFKRARAKYLMHLYCCINNNFPDFIFSHCLCGLGAVFMCAALLLRADKV